ncbi:MAG: hypothetical protein JWQ49_6660 [Edaphobacter sp.]|nr:hypothetical protein [Edaphobacter sp.]
MRKTKTIATELRIFLLVEVIAVFACVGAEVFHKLVLHHPSFPFTNPFPDDGFTFTDFAAFSEAISHFGHPAFLNSGYTLMYPAPMWVLYKIFYSYPAHPLRLFLAFILGSFLFSGFLLARALYRRGVPLVDAAIFIAVTLAISYPLWFEIRQANFEICVWVVVTIGIWAFVKDHLYLAAFCFGMACAMKIFPFVYLGLLLSRQKYREIAFAALTAFITTIISLRLMGPDILNSWRHVQTGLKQFRHIYALQYKPMYIGFDHSFFALYKRFLPLPPYNTLSHILSAYLAVAAVAGVILYFTRIRHLPLINQVLCLCIPAILLPPVSFDYTLMHLYTPWAMLVLLAQDRFNAGRKTPALLAALVCLALLFTPESEFIVHGDYIGGQIKAILLALLMYIALKYPFTEPAPEPTTSSPLIV